MPLLILFIIVLIGCVILYATRPKVTVNVITVDPLALLKKAESPDDIKYYNGPKPTKLQEERNKQSIFEHIEQFPNGVLATNNPEYLEEYLNRIDLNLPPGITTQDDNDTK